LLAESLPEAIVIHGRGRRLLFANRAAAALVGAAGPADIVGRLALDFVPPEDLPVVTARIQRIARGEGVGVPAEERLLRLDGTTIDVEVWAMPVHYEGEPAIQVILRDVSERKRRNEALGKVEAKFHLITETIPVVFWIWDPSEPEQWYVSPAAERIFGHPREDFRTNPQLSLQCIHPEDQTRVLPAILGSFREPYDLEYRIVRRDGDVRWVRSRSFPRLDGAGELSSVTGVVEDVTERKRAEEQYRLLFASTPDAIAINDAEEGRFLTVNPGWERLSGFSLDEAVGKTHVDLGIWVSEETFRHVLAEITAKGRVLNVEAELRRKGGETIWALFSALKIDVEGSPCILSFSREVTDRKLAAERLAAALVRAEAADRLKTAFLANMSHEIRTPLNVILGLSSFVAEHLAEAGDQSQDQYLDGIRRASRRLLATIHGVLDLSRIEANGFEIKPTPVDLAAIVRQQVDELEPLARDRGIGLVARIEAEPVVPFDEHCLSQALMNLIDNAIKFTDHGTVSVRLAVGPDGSPVLEVEDTGVGIDEAYLPRLFEPFSQEDFGHTRRFEGSGLGLALVRRYLDMNNACISVRSRKGAGSTFRIEFAAGAATAPPSGGT
jgi:PAS domain S-box-containing protein